MTERRDILLCYNKFMEKSPLEGNDYESREDRESRELEDLRALGEVLGLTILREEKFNGVMSGVVDDGRG